MARTLARVGEWVERHLEPAVRSGAAALAAVDLDHFKELNDEYDFAVGDKVLDAAEDAIAKNLPATVVVARKGGDEWHVLFPGSAPEDALILMEEVRSHFASRPPVPEVRHPVGMHVGIAGVPAHATDWRGLVHAAEEACQRAKAQGTNVAMYVEEKMVLKSNYYAKGQLARLAKVSDRMGRTEASLLREALEDVLDKYRDE